MRRYTSLLLLSFFLFSVFMIGCSKQQKLDAENARSHIRMIYNACKMFVGDRDRWPASAEELEELGYIEIDDDVRLKWVFTIYGTDSISAYSTSEMSGGADHRITLNIVQVSFSGWRIKGYEEYDY